MRLEVLIILPLLTIACILLAKRQNAVRILALIGAALQWVAALLLYAGYQRARVAGQEEIMLFKETWNWYPSWQVSFTVGVDGVSVSMILLTAFVVLAGVLVSWQMDRMPKTFFLLLTLLGLGAYGFFISLNLFTLFFFLELAVIPKYMLIGIWGSGRKTYSANKLALMLMAGSALILAGMLALYYGLPQASRTFDMVAISDYAVPVDLQRLVFPLLFVGFGVFTAIFPFHTWVPDGHASAPTAGSMFLAGISMKLGGYGCLRAAAWLLPEGAVIWSDWIIVLSAIAILYGAFATMLQRDLKYMNAYSSISHCGFVLLGIGMMTQTALTGAVYQMISHGLMTALFFAAIGMIYERSHTRVIPEMSGLLRVAPFLSVVIFLAGLCSLGLPGLSGFVAEMTVFMGSWERQGTLYRVATVAACMSIVVTAVYILRAIGQITMGPLSASLAHGVRDARWYERAAALILILGILAMGLAPHWLQELVTPGVEMMMEKMDLKVGGPVL